MIWREKSLDGKEKLRGYHQTIGNHHVIRPYVIILPSDLSSSVLAFMTNHTGSKRAYKRCDFFVFFSPQISIPCHTFSVCHITLLPMLYLLDVFIHLTFYTTHNFLNL